MKTKLFALIVLLLFLFPLAGCFGVIPKLDVALKLSPNEEWDFSVEFHVPQSIYTLSGTEFQNELMNNQQEAEAKGYTFDWQVSEVNEEGNVVVHMNFNGQGYQKLNEEIFDPTTITVQEDNGDQILNFNLSTYGSEFGEMFLVANESSFFLEGGEILSTNGTQLDKNTVIWNNPGGVLSARMKLPSSNTTAMILIGAGIFLIGFAVFKVARNRTASSVSPEVSPQTPSEEPIQRTTQDTSAKRYCINCGNELPSGAKFCIKCGSKQP